MGSTRPVPALSRHIGDEFPTLEGLAAAAEAARDLVGHPGWDVLCRLLEAEVATIDRQLDGDRPLEARADYAHAHGRRGGLRAAPAFMTALIDKADAKLAEQRRRHEGAGETALEGVA